MKKIDHVGVAVPSLAEAKPFYAEGLGLKLLAEEEVAEQRVRVAMFQCGESRIELLEPTSPESPIAKFLEKKGSGIHHIAVEVKDVEAELNALQAQGVKLIDTVARIGAGGHKIAFVHPKSTSCVLLELTQK